MVSTEVVVDSELSISHEDVVELVDNAIDEIKGKTIVSAAEMIDVLLDVRQAISMMENDAHNDGKISTEEDGSVV